MEAKKADSPTLTSPAAFVEGGIQDVCEDACSICLEEFCESDPSTVTNCRHEFHLHCILEWCQRSSQCPMCWQTIGLKDPSGQELFEGVERERNIRAIASRRTNIFHSPTLEDFEFGHLTIGANDDELEQHIILHLAAAAGMGRVHHAGRRGNPRSTGRRESPTGQLSFQGWSQYSAFPARPGAPQSRHVSSSPTQVGGETEPAIGIASPSVALTSREEQLAQNIRFSSGQSNQTPPLSSMSMAATRRGFSFTQRGTSSYPSSSDQDRAGSSEFQSFSESFKARFNEVSVRYKETFSRTTRDLKDRLFSRSSSMSDLGSQVLGEVTSGIANVSHMMERLETRGRRMNQTFMSNQSAEHGESDGNKLHSQKIHRENPNGNTAASSSANSFSS